MMKNQELYEYIKNIKTPSEPHRFKTPSEPLTDEEKRMMLRRIERAEKLGINMSRLDKEDEMLGKESDDLDELEALFYIMKDEEVPEEIQIRLLNRKVI